MFYIRTEQTEFLQYVFLYANDECFTIIHNLWRISNKVFVKLLNLKNCQIFGFLLLFKREGNIISCKNRYYLIWWSVLKKLQMMLTINNSNSVGQSIKFVLFENFGFCWILFNHLDKFE